MERSMPKSIDYQDVLPVAVPAVQRRRKFFPVNGTSFGPDGTNEIRIPISSQNSMLDAQNSFVEMTVVNQGGGATFGIDIGGGHTFFDEVRLEQGGRVLSRIQEYNRLHCGILAPVQDHSDGRITQSITEQTNGLRSGAGLAAGAIAPAAPGGGGDVYSDSVHATNTFVGAADSVTFTFRPTQGLFDQDKLVPLPLVSPAAPMELVLRLTDVDNIGVWSAPPIDNAYIVSRISYVASLIEVGSDVVQQVKQIQAMSGGQLVLSGTDIEHTSGDLPIATAGEVPIRCPIRKKSVQSLLFNMQSNDYTNGAAGLAANNVFNLSFAGSANMDTYQLKVGSVVYPPQPVNCWGSTAAAGAEFRRSECAMELAKAFGALGFTTPTGYLSTLTYGTTQDVAFAAGLAPALTDGDNGDGAGGSVAPASGTSITATPFGLDLQSFQHEAIESGVNSEKMALETNLVLNISNATSGIEAKTVHMFLLFDQHYMFGADGMITSSS